MSLAPSNSSTESFIAVWKTANWPNTTEDDKKKKIEIILGAAVWKTTLSFSVTNPLTKLRGHGDVVGAGLLGGVVQRVVW